MSGILNPATLVLGASGTVGSGVVGALLEAGGPVLAAGCKGPRMDALVARHAGESGLQPMPISCIRSDRDGLRLASAVRKRGQPLRAVFACLAGPRTSGRLLDKPVDALTDTLELDLLPHLASARHLLPLLAESARGGMPAHYVLVGGTCAERGWSGYGHASVSAAALNMLACVLHEEAAPLGVIVQLLSIDHPICTPENIADACAGWPDALAVGRRAVSLLARNGQRVRPVVRFSDAWAPPPPHMFASLPVPSPSSSPSHRGIHP